MNGTSQTQHISVMRDEAVAALAPRDGGIYIDATFGRGGYTRAILATGGTRVFGIDRDPDAIAAGRDMVASFAPRLVLLHGVMSEMEQLLSAHNVTAVDGVVMDLGVSSPQLDDAARGFSFQADGPLDMRMSAQGPSAADLVNKADEKTLADIIFHFGEERHARRVARRIVEARKEAPLTRTGALASLVRAAVPRSKDGIDPATRTFQGLRIAVNDELDDLTLALGAAERLLRPEGRLAVVTFHSLEDRIVKDFLRSRSGGAPLASRHLPLPGQAPRPTFSLLFKKPLSPTQDEIAANPRARSARLRAALRTEALALKEDAA